MKWEKACLSISVRKTSSLIEWIRSSPNVKRVYPPEADRLARFIINTTGSHYGKIPSSRFELCQPLPRVKLCENKRERKVDAGKVWRSLFQRNASLGTIKVIYSGMMTQWSHTASLLSRDLTCSCWRRVWATECFDWRKTRGYDCCSPCCYLQKTENYWVNEFFCDREHALYMMTFLDGVYCPALHGNHEDENALKCRPHICSWLCVIPVLHHMWDGR